MSDQARTDWIIEINHRMLQTLPFEQTGLGLLIGLHGAVEIKVVAREIS